MKLIEKLADKEMDEMILETDVDETHCPQRFADVPVPQNRGIPRERIPERVVIQIVNMSVHTQSDGEDRQRFAISRSKLRTHRMRRLSQDTIHQRTGERVVNKHVQQCRKLSGGEAVQDLQEDRTENPIVLQKINQVSKQKGNSIQSQHI